ncbi:hypothetical protein GIS00_05425 [Nakamurella sp. YIM 132087]|uniref:Uncharacterized protein n=1 Tax=Nakamurella alba TaxID=2665158 RepID=A0A7K1FGY0_9ACTN|nr:hypothetical protein [Nakamurella alba]MTD13387.1 hypothetical protein [Nakamurella alba]
MYAALTVVGGVCIVLPPGLGRSVGIGAFGVASAVVGVVLLFNVDGSVRNFHSVWVDLLRRRPYLLGKPGTTTFFRVVGLINIVLGPLLVFYGFVHVGS